jgi:hypothetical protein
MEKRMRKLLFAAMAVLIGLTATSASALADNVWVGTWVLNVAKSAYSPGPAPAAETVVTTDVGGGMFKSTIDATTASGKSAHSEITYAFDGKDYPISGVGQDRTASAMLPDPQTMMSVLKMGGKIIGSTTLKMAPDLKSYTATAESTTPDGKPVKNVAVFEKQ